LEYSGIISKKGEEFWDYVRQFEIVCLVETWVEERSWKRIEKSLSKLQVGRSRGKKRKEKGKSCRGNKNRGELGIKEKRQER
jgi:hypothetical protein